MSILEIRFPDVHTHSIPKETDFAIYNLRFGTERLPNPIPKWFSVGIHPWDIPNLGNVSFLPEIEILANHQNCLAIGECGLDKNISASKQQQIDCLFPQLELAEKLQKPVILHVVKTIGWLEEVYRTIKPSVPWILHGYNGKITTLNNIRNNGWFVSLGKPLLFGNTNKLNEYLIQLEDYCLVETDDSKMPIVELYQRLEAVGGNKWNELCIRKRFCKLFLKHLSE
ncbi:MAG: TatD family hydrolase [Bacteroidia bacterium]|nr:TatD family hydrolase [Bacteroidia bacterium]